MAASNASTIGAQIQASPQLRQRIVALVRNVWWNDSTSDPTAHIPIDDLAWSVAATASIRTTISQSLSSNNNDWNIAIEAVTDANLLTVVTAALARIKALTPAVV